MTWLKGKDLFQLHAWNMVRNDIEPDLELIHDSNILTPLWIDLTASINSSTAQDNALAWCLPCEGLP